MAPAPSGAACGAIRCVSDGERERTEAFCARHPEFERLGHDALLQIAGTYRDDDDQRVMGELRDAGVQKGWRSAGGRDYETGDFRMAEES